MLSFVAEYTKKEKITLYITLITYDLFTEINGLCKIAWLGALTLTAVSFHFPPLCSTPQNLLYTL